MLSDVKQRFWSRRGVRWACNRLVLVALVASSAGCVHRIVEPPVFVSGGAQTRASTHCAPEFEGVPCAVTDEDASIGWVAAFGTGRYSWSSDNWRNWEAGSGSSSGFSVPVNRADPNGLVRLTGDAWLTYSESKNLVFAYFIGRLSNNASCVAVAATSPQSLETNTWDFEAVCAVPQSGDQCAILHADSTNTFYTACSANSGIRIDAFDDCSGAPGAAYGCPPTATTQFNPSGVQVLQFDLGENSCSGNLLMPYRANGRIRLAVFDPTLQLVDDHLVRSNQAQRVNLTNAGCCNGVIRRCGMGTSDCRDQARCGSKPGDQCLAVSARPSIDVHRDQRGSVATCRAVIAYDSLVDGEDGNPWSKSRLDLLDVTNDQDPEVLARWDSTDDEFTWNHYLSYAVFADRGRGKKPAIGWFWLSDVRSPCEVVPEGTTSVDFGATMQPTPLLGESFPAINMGSFGMGDYVRGVKGGDRDGGLLFSWGQTVPSEGCVACEGRTWNLASRVARIYWKRKMWPARRPGESLLPNKVALP